MPLSAGTSLATSNNERLAGRRRWRPFAVSAACFVLGVVIFGIQIETLEEDGLSSYENGLLLWDFLVGFVAVIAVGPMSRAGRWNYLLLLASPSALSRHPQRWSPSSDSAGCAVAGTTSRCSLFSSRRVLSRRH